MLARWHPPNDRSAGRSPARSLRARCSKTTSIPRASCARSSTCTCGHARSSARCRGLAHAVPLHDQRLPRLQPRLHVLLRAADARVPRPERRRRLRAAHRRQGQRRRAARGRAGAAELARRAHRDGDEHRSLPAVRGPLPPHARHRRDARRGTQPLLDPHEVDDGAARSRRARGGGRAHERARELLDRHARRGRLAHQRARHAPAAPARRGARAADRGRHPLRRARWRRSCLGSPTATSSSPRSCAPASRPAPSRSRASACTCGLACASSSCPGSRACGPTSSRATSELYGARSGYLAREEQERIGARARR